MRETGTGQVAQLLDCHMMMVIIIIIIVVIIVVVIIISFHRFSFFPVTSPLEPVVNPTTQASNFSL
jgi:flagellar basal body-associated protein FliL